MQPCVCRRALEITLCDDREIECGAEADLAHRENAVCALEAFGEPLRFDEDPLHFGDSIGCVIDVAEVARERLVSLPTQSRRNDLGAGSRDRLGHRSTGRAGSRIHSLNEPAYSVASGSPAYRIARMLWHAVTPDPQ